ncbi:MAG: hypothetical protein BWY15_01157 [Firmicutes bacterium ADurb.Bin193]|nr:MAG: hypothetical protein BWY15_01157 [Firmicutes bacterium ADurb.Bin193]
MPKVSFIEKTIYELEGIKVDFVKDGKNLRGDVDLPYNYKGVKMTKNSANVSFLKDKLKKQYCGYDFWIYDGNGNKARGNLLLGNLRDTYLSDEEDVS